MYTERIQEIYSDLSPGYRRVADYLVNNYRERGLYDGGRSRQSIQG